MHIIFSSVTNWENWSLTSGSRQQKEHQTLFTSESPVSAFWEHTSQRTSYGQSSAATSSPDTMWLLTTLSWPMVRRRMFPSLPVRWSLCIKLSAKNCSAPFVQESVGVDNSASFVRFYLDWNNGQLAVLVSSPCKTTWHQPVVNMPLRVPLISLRVVYRFLVKYCVMFKAALWAGNPLRAILTDVSCTQTAETDPIFLQEAYLLLIRPSSQLYTWI